MKMKKLIAILCASVLALGVLGVTAGCGQDSEKLIRDSLTEQLDTYKNKDDSVLSATSTMLANQGLEQMGIDTDELAVSILDGMDYTIDSVTVDGNKAEAKLTIVSKSYSEFEAAVQQAVQEVTNDPNITNMDQQQIMELYGQKVMNAIANIQPTPEEATIEYELKGNQWEPVKGEHALADLDSIVFAE